MKGSLYQKYQQLQVFIYALQLSEWPFKEIKRENALAELTRLAQILGINLTPKSPDFLPTLETAIDKILAQKDETIPSIPPNLAELVEIYEQHLAEAKQKQITDTFPTLDEEIENLYHRYQQKIFKEIENLAGMVKNKQLAEIISNEIALKITRKLPQVAAEDLLFETISFQTYQAEIKKILQQEYQRIKVGPLKEKITNDLAEKIAKQTRQEVKLLAKTPRYLQPVNHLAKPVPSNLASVQLRMMPVLDWQAVKTKAVFFKKVLALTKKLVIAPIFKPLQFLIELAPEKFQRENPELFYILKIGLTPSAVWKKIELLKKQNAPHPQLLFWQQLNDRLVTFGNQHSVVTFLATHYFDYQRLGKIIGFSKPLESRFWQFISRGKIKNFKEIKRHFWQIFKKTKLGRWLGRGAKKILTKLGLSSLAGPVGVLISFWPQIKKLLKWVGRGLTVVFLWAAHLGAAAAAGFGVGVIGGGVGGIIVGFKAGGLVGAVIGGPIGILVGSILGTLIGFGVQLLWNKVAMITAGFSLPQFISGSLAQATGATVGILAKVSVLGGITAAAAGTLIVLQTDSGAFVQKGGLGEPFPTIGRSIPARPIDQASHLAEKVIYTLNQCGIRAVVKSNWPMAKNCLQNSQLINKNLIINQFEYSVQLEPYFSLQCVGFIRGVMAALGKDPGGGRHANGYLNPPTPTGWEPANTDMQLVKINDLVIFKGETYGHIGIVIDKKGDQIIVAQAWGYTKTGAKGVLQITEVNPVYFDGFLRPQ